MELMATPQPASEKPSLDSFARKLRRMRLETFQKNTYFT